MADAFGIVVALHDSSGPVSTAASLHAAVTIPKDSPPAYTVESVVLLQGPTSQLEQKPGTNTIVTAPVNPLRVNNTGLAPAASLLARVLSAGDSARNVAQSGFHGSYSVVATDREPLITIDTVSGDRAAAAAANDKIFAMMSAEIDRRQAATINEPTEKVTLGYVIQDEPRVAQTSKWRAAAVLFLAGLLVTFVITVTIDALLLSRRRRRAPRARTATVAPEGGVHS